MQEELQTGNLVESAKTIKEPRPTSRGFRVDNKKFLALPTVALWLLALDQILKWTAVTYRPELSFGPVEFTLFMNTGIVFSLPVPQWIYLPIAIIIFAIFFIAYIKAFKKRTPAAGGLSFVVFGALSNLIDRYEHGATVDYLLFFERSAVNIADGMILLGVVLYIRARNIHQNDKGGSQ